MKKVILLLTTILSFTFVNAQNPLKKGQVQLNAGTGFSAWGIPVYAGLDFGIHKDISIGIEASYRRYHEDYYYNTYDYKYTHSAFAFGTNGNYHFNSLIGIPKKFDFYAGVNITYFAWNSDYTYKSDNGNGNDYWKPNYTIKSSVEPGVQVGGRYFFNDSFGLNTEIGAGAVTGAKFGITYQF